MNAYNHDQDQYIHNIHECQRIYLKLNVFEITIRNKINQHFVDVIGNKWLLNIEYDRNHAFGHKEKNKKYNISSFDSTRSLTGFFVGNSIYNQVSSAIAQIKKQNQKQNKSTIMTNDSIVGGLTLGFWSNIFDNTFLKYYRTFNFPEYKNLLINILGVNPAHIGNLVEINLRINEINSIRDFRNRVFHYEKILHQVQYNEQLLDKYIQFLDEDNNLQSFLVKAISHW